MSRIPRNPAPQAGGWPRNIHYDVFLSPKFVEFTGKYLLDLIRQTVNITLHYKQDWERERKHRACQPEHAAFRKILTEVLQQSVTRANSSSRSSLISFTGSRS